MTLVVLQLVVGSVLPQGYIAVGNEDRHLSDGDTMDDPPSDIVPGPERDRSRTIP